MAYFGTLAPYIAPQGGPNGVNHISMYLGYHNIEIKTRDILKLNFGIWMIDCMKHGLYVKVFSDLIKRKDMLIVASARLPKYVRLYVVFKFPIHLSKSSKLGIQNISFRGNNSYLLREKYLFWINFKKRTV